MRLAIGVMAHPSRLSLVHALEERHEIDAVVIDHNGWGENVTGNLTWRLLGQSGADWAIVLQDDALPVENFRTHAAAALEFSTPTGVSFYVGTGHPVTVQPGLIRAITQAQEREMAWLESDRMLWGVAIAMPVVDIPEYLKWSDGDEGLYDDRIGRWFWRTGRKLRYTMPSLVDHADLPSLVSHRKDPKPRRAYQLGVSHNGYNTGAVRIPDF